MPYYAVARGRTVGIFRTWDECEQQVKGFSGAKHKKFRSKIAATQFIQSYSFSSANDPKSYGTSVKSQPTLSTNSSTTYATVGAVTALGASANTHHASSDLLSRVLQNKQDSDYAVVYTDGACSYNGGGKPSAGIGVYWGPGDRWNVSERLKGKQTNNRAEIHAVRRAVEQAHLKGITKLKVRTDSQFLINCYTKWMPNWKRNDWKLSTGGKVKNRADLEALEETAQGIDLKFEHVTAHAGVVGNEKADRLAVAGSQLPYLYNHLDYSIDGDEWYDDSD